MPDHRTADGCESPVARIERVLSAARRRVAMHIPNLHLSRAWQDQIRWLYAALLREAALSGEPLNTVLETRSSHSAVRVGKYCVRHFETLALRDLRDRLEACCKRDHRDMSEINTLLDRLETSLARLDQAEIARPPIKTKRRIGAARLKLHPDGWQENLVASAPGKLRVALLILQATGCRPCEIERGIAFQIGQELAEVRLTVEVTGAKCDAYRGQPLRTFQFLGEDQRPGVTELIAALTRHRDKTCSSIFRLSDISNRVEKRSRQLWPSHQVRPSAYSFRYAFRGQLALLGATRQEIARAMGHQSIISSLSYGRQVARERTQELVMEISASIEPRYPHQYLENGDRFLEERGQSRVVARDIPHELYRAQRF